MLFPVSGVETPFWLPPLVGLGISFFSSIGGVSGAFLILPFQISILGFSSPAVTPTNLVFNIVGIPGGVYRYVKEGRLCAPLAWNIIVGTLPGLFLGGVIRIVYLPDPAEFKLFVGAVLVYVGARSLIQTFSHAEPGGGAAAKAEQKMRAGGSAGQATVGESSGPAIRTISRSLKETVYEFYGEQFRYNTLGLFGLSLVVGLIGGIYGIGGGAIIAPFIVTIFGLPVHTIAGATLMGTFVTSIGGVLFYQLIASSFAPPDLAVSPDWRLGVLFGLGGLVGMYLGAAAQRHVSASIIKPVLGLVVLGLAGKYIAGYFM